MLNTFLTQKIDVMNKKGTRLSHFKQFITQNLFFSDILNFQQKTSNLYFHFLNENSNNHCFYLNSNEDVVINSVYK